MKYTPEYYIKKFFKQPVERWWVGGLYNYQTGASCALGQCEYLPSYYHMSDEEKLRAKNSERRTIDRMFVTTLGVALSIVNDGRHIRNTPAQAKKAVLCSLLEIYKNHNDKDYEVYN